MGLNAKWNMSIKMSRLATIWSVAVSKIREYISTYVGAKGANISAFSLPFLSH